MKILVIEDEQKVAAFIRSGLEEYHHDVEVAYDGLVGEKLSTANDYDIILLDIMIPGINGLNLCRKIKAVKPNVPLLMLTALGTTSDKVTGFDAGADDYLVKPFDFDELVARIKALTKRLNTVIPKESSMLQVADLKLDLNTKIASRGDVQITLTAKEFDLLEYFMRNRGRVISRPELAEKIWDITFDTGTNIVDVYINILRRKIDKNYPVKLLHTRIGFGYMFTVNPS